MFLLKKYPSGQLVPHSFTRRKYPSLHFVQLRCEGPKQRRQFEWHFKQARGVIRSIKYPKDSAHTEHFILVASSHSEQASIHFLQIPSANKIIIYKC